MKPEKLRTYTFKPYLGKHRPHFILTTWDVNRRDSNGKRILRYRLTMVQPALKVCGDTIPRRREVIFEGEDFAVSPLHAVDSVAAAEGIMCFLTLRPGDTDAEYFAGYTPRQREFADTHAEGLAAEYISRWCDENGNIKKRYR